MASSTPAMSDQATSTLASGLISTGLVLGIVFSVRHMTTAMRTMKSSEPKPCQSVPNCWTFSENDCLGTATVVLTVPLGRQCPRACCRPAPWRPWVSSGRRGTRRGRGRRMRGRRHVLFHRPQAAEPLTVAADLDKSGPKSAIVSSISGPQSTSRPPGEPPNEHHDHRDPRRHLRPRSRPQLHRLRRQVQRPRHLPQLLREVRRGASPTASSPAPPTSRRSRSTSPTSRATC